MSDNVLVKAKCNNCGGVHGLDVNLEKLRFYKQAAGDFLALEPTALPMQVGRFLQQEFNVKIDRNSMKR